MSENKLEKVEKQNLDNTLSLPARKARKYLMAISTLIILVFYLGINITTFNVFGASIQLSNSKTITWVLSVFLVYFLSAFLIYSWENIKFLWENVMEYACQTHFKKYKLKHQPEVKRVIDDLGMFDKEDPFNEKTKYEEEKINENYKKPSKFGLYRLIIKNIASLKKFVGKCFAWQVSKCMI